MLEFLGVIFFAYAKRQELCSCGPYDNMCANISHFANSEIGVSEKDNLKFEA